jgi:hypothetical protein
MIGYSFEALSDSKQSKQAAERNETEAERLDRNLIELLQELRVASIGVQFLFAFLLVLPFQQGWTHVTDFEKRVYYVDLLLTAMAGICMMGPVARHRLRFRDRDKEWIVKSSHKYAIAGLAFLGLAIAGTILLISHVVFSSALAIVACVLTLAIIGWIWFGAALLRVAQDRGANGQS